MKKKLLLLNIINILYSPLVLADTRAACGNTDNIPAALPEFVRLIFLLIKYLIPVALILYGSIDFLKVLFSGSNVGLDRVVKKMITRVIAGVSVFFIVFLIQFFVKEATEDDGIVECISCFTTNEDSCRLYVAEEDDGSSEKTEADKKRESLNKKREEERKKQEEEAKKAKEIAKKDKDDDSILNGRMVQTCLDYSYAGNGKVKSRFSSHTLEIVEKHLNDFDYSNFVSRTDDFKVYMNSLGGVFSSYYGKKMHVTSAKELQLVSEYVFGMMYMYGFDYYNGPTRKYCKWGGSCKDMDKIRMGELPQAASSDAFYPGTIIHSEDGLSGPLSDFDKLISNQGEINMTTNCNWTVDMIYYKAGLFGGKGQPGGSADAAAMGRKYKIISDPNDLQVGDIVHFFENGIDKTNPDTWNGWYHVAFIGEVDSYNKKVVGYDGGSYFTNNRNFKWEAKIEGSETKLHGTKNWAAVRIADLDQSCI